MMIYYNSKMDEISSQFNDFINITANNYNYIAENENFLHWIKTKEYTDATDQSVDIYEIKKLLSNTTLNIPHIASVYLYNKNTDYVISLYTANHLENFYDNNWYDQYVRNNYRDIICYREASESSYVTMCRSVSAGDDNVGGLIIFNFEANQFRKFFFADSNSSNITITSQSGNLVYTDAFGLDKNKNYITLTTDCIESFYHISVQFDSELFNEQKKLSSLSVFLSVIIVVIASLFISFGISKRFYTSLFNIINIFQNEYDQDGDMTVEVNTIINNVLQLKEKNEEIEGVLAEKISALRRSQILTLQEQINPHFIFNTLNLISMTAMAEYKKQNNITKIIKLLSDILKGVLDTENYTCSFNTELTYVDKYIQLQNIKFDNHIRFIKQIDNDVLGFSCVKFMLQPIIENSIDHGILSNDDIYGEINLKAFKEDGNFKIIISDNGPGIPPEKLDTLKKMLKEQTIPHKKHIGITNVHRRIQLIYGDKYGLKIYSDSLGTTIEYTLPCKIYTEQ